MSLGSYLREHRRAVIVLSILMLGTVLYWLPAAAQTTAHAHMYVDEGTRACENPGTPPTMQPNQPVTLRFCTHDPGHIPNTGEAVTWSLNSPDGNASFVGTPESTTRGTGPDQGEAEAKVLRTTEGTATIQGLWNATGQTASVTVTWSFGIADHVHLLTAVGTAGNACHGNTAVPPGNASSAGSSHERTIGTGVTVTACVHDSAHSGVAGRSVSFGTTDLGSASAQPAADTEVSDGSGLATYTFTSPTSGKTQSSATSDAKVSNLYTVTWTRPVHHVHVIPAGASCHDSVTGTFEVGVTNTVVACAHGAAHDGIADSRAAPSTDSADDFEANVSWLYGGVGGPVGTPESRTDVNGQARLQVRSEQAGSARVTATVSTPDSSPASNASGGMSINYIPPQPGYWIFEQNGGVHARGAAGFFGAAFGVAPSGVVDGESTVTRTGYWILESNGGVHARGDAGFFGGAFGVVPSGARSMASHPSGCGYWILEANGGVHARGCAGFFGAAFGVVPSGAVEIAVTPDGGGYWIFEQNGGVHARGNATFLGAAFGSVPSGVEGADNVLSGGGYWITESNGGVHARGNAGFFGGAFGVAPSGVRGLSGTVDNLGYWIVEQNGGVHARGNAGFLGAAFGSTASPVVDIEGRGS